MKPEEVIKYLEMVRPTENYSHTFSVSVGNTKHFGPGSQLNKDVSTAIDLAIEALEKQIPKKPKTDDNRILCPTCNLLIAYNKSIEQHCWTCGQNLEGCVIK